MNALLVLATGVAVAANLFTYLLQAMGQFASTSAVEIGEVVLRVLFVVGGGYAWGVPGLVAGGLLATIGVKGLVLPRILSKVLETRWLSAADLLTRGKSVAVVCLAGGLVWRVLVPPPGTWMGLIWQAIACGSILAASTLANGELRERARSLAGLKTGQQAV